MTSRAPFVSLRRAAALAATAALLALAGCASTPPRSELLGQFDAVLQTAQPARDLKVEVVPPTAVIGQPIALRVQTATPAYLYVIQAGSGGQGGTLVFPNALDPYNLVPAGDTLLPRPSWRMTARGPAGTGYLLVVLAAQPQDVARLTQELAAGRIAITGSYRAALATVTETAP